jgi:hypothetical protein
VAGHAYLGSVKIVHPKSVKVLSHLSHVL